MRCGWLVHVPRVDSSHRLLPVRVTPPVIRLRYTRLYYSGNYVRSPFRIRCGLGPLLRWPLVEVKLNREERGNNFCSIAIATVL